MTTSPATALDNAVSDHLLLNFTDANNFRDRPVPMIVRGEGCEVIDSEGRRFIDGLSGLFCSNLGHDYGAEVGSRIQQQLSELVYTPTWSLSHPSAASLGERLANIAAPLNLNRVYLTLGGGESVEAAWKIARQWHAANGQPQRTKAIARDLAYHGTSMGALSFTGLADCQEPFAPMAIPVSFVSNTNAFRHPIGHDEAALTASLLAEIDQTIQREGPQQIAMFIAEPVQNSGGAFTPPAGYWQGLRDLCDRYGILLVADETITGFGRLGEWFACMRLGAQPDMITFAKGATAAHAPLGGVLMGDRVAAPFVSGDATYMHGLTFSGHPLTTAAALAAFDIYEREHVFENVRANEAMFSDRLNELRRIPLVGDVRGAGYFWAVEVVKNPDTLEPFTPEEGSWLLRQELSGHMDRLGLLCRLDDRGEPIIQLSPPLVADAAMIDRIVSIVGEATERAWESWNGRASMPAPQVVGAA